MNLKPKILIPLTCFIDQNILGPKETLDLSSFFLHVIWGNWRPEKWNNLSEDIYIVTNRAQYTNPTFRLSKYINIC